MNILYITHYSDLYGANKSLLNVIDGIKKKGVNPYVILPNTPGDLEVELKNRNIQYKKYFYRPWVRTVGRKRPIREFVIKILNSFVSYCIARDIMRWNIDLVHTNSICTDVGVRAAIKEKRNHIFHIREFMEEDYNLEFFNQKKAFRLINYSRRVIVISRALYDKFAKNIPKNKLSLIYNGLEVPTVFKEDHLLKETIRILLVGFISVQKGTQEAIDAINELVNEGMNNLQLLIVGTGEKEYEDYLKEYVRNLKLEKNVLFLGYRKDVEILRKEADLCLVCSKSEAFGRVTVEAMFSKVPLIATNTAGTAEIVRNFETGIVYESGNYQDLAQKIRYALSNYDEMRRIADNAYQYALENYTIAKNVEKIYSEYESIN
ncbi:MAG TPA: glycosyltransferase family 4 protein [Bacillota bacterium]|nr:glycosyltransferase family 4 protein [Bacillota bacterium]